MSGQHAIRQAVAWIKSRYGTNRQSKPARWYDRGGRLTPSVSVARNDTGQSIPVRRSP